MGFKNGVFLVGVCLIEGVFYLGLEVWLGLIWLCLVMGFVGFVIEFFLYIWFWEKVVVFVATHDGRWWCDIICCYHDGSSTT